MVRALLAGTKTQTRRIVKPQPAPDQQPRTVIGSSGFVYVMDNAPLLPYPEVRRVRWDCPYGQPGDRLWVRETFGHFERNDNFTPGCEVFYRADGGCLEIEPWRPSIHMPRWASRITLEITGVRVERLQDIDISAAQAEGVSDTGSLILDSAGNEQGGPIAEYAVLWEQINGPGSWDANPWVWVLEFRRLP